jgi:predicted dehydrogenase
MLINSVQGKSDKVTFVSDVTRTPANAADNAVNLGIPLSTNFSNALNYTNVKAIVSAMLHTQHAEQMTAIAAAKKHIFIEKPFTLDTVSAIASVKAARDEGVVLALGQNRRFLPPLLEMKRRIYRGNISTVIHADANFSGNPSLRHRSGSTGAPTSMRRPQAR